MNFRITLRSYCIKYRPAGTSNKKLYVTLSTKKFHCFKYKGNKFRRICSISTSQENPLSKNKYPVHTIHLI